MSDKFTVKKVKDGPRKGYWGVYFKGALMMSFKTKAGATMDANRRNK